MLSKVQKVWNVLSMPAECKLLDEDEHVMTIEEFIECCDNESFIDDDGMGSWATETYYLPGHWIYPSDFTCGDRLDKPEWATHVVWYNK